MDERSAEWIHLLLTGKDNSVLVFGHPIASILFELSKIAKKVYLVSTTEHGNYHDDNVEMINLRLENIFTIADQTVQAGIIITEPFDSDYVFKELQRVLPPGGKLAILSNGCGFRALKRETRLRKKLVRSGFTDIEMYGIVPGMQDPRWIVPIDNGRDAAVALQLYQPNLPSAKIKKSISQILSYSGLSRLLTTDTILFAKCSGSNSKDLKEVFKKALGRTDVRLAIFTGTPGYHRKVAIQAWGKNGEILAYGKLAENEQTYRLLENEVRILKCLSSLRFTKGRVPEVLFWGDIGSGNLLIQTTCKKAYSRTSHKLTQSHVEFLAELFSKTFRKQIFGKSYCFLKLKSRIDKLVKNQNNAWAKRLAKGLRYIESNLEKNELPLGLCHRDFVPWNTFYNGKRLFVFDWEYAREESIPFWDMFHFVIQHNILVRRKKPLVILNILTGGDKDLSSLINRYASVLNLNPDLNLHLLLFYLCDISCFYLNKLNKQMTIEDKEKNSLDTWAQMIDLLLNKPESLCAS